MQRLALRTDLLRPAAGLVAAAMVVVAVRAAGSPAGVLAAAALSALAVLLFALPWRQAVERRDAEHDAALAALVEARQAVEVHARERAEAEAGRTLAESTLAARAAFLASMSHELRTPLNGVIAVADLLGRSGLDPNQRRLVAIVRDSGETLLALINDLLDVAKLENGRMELEEIGFDPAEILTKVVSMHSIRAEEKGITLTLDQMAAGSVPVQGDPVRLRQVLHNLLSNAVKFTDAGGVRVSAETRAIGEDVELLVTVSDTGIGMNEAQRGLIFEPFAQADRSITRRYGGTGLGLSICRNICELMQGWIEVESEVGHGSTFTFCVRLARNLSVRQPTERPVLEAASRQARRAVPGRISIAVSAANDVTRRVLEMALCTLDVDYEFVTPGRELQDARFFGGYDLMLIDLTGQRAAMCSEVAALRRQEAAKGMDRFPVAALTSSAAQAGHPAAEAAEDFDGVLGLPLRATALFEFIDRIGDQITAAGEPSRRAI